MSLDIVEYQNIVKKDPACQCPLSSTFNRCLVRTVCYETRKEYKLFKHILNCL